MERTFSKLGGGKKDNVQWYYIDKDNNYVGPVNTHKMRQLKKFDYVTPESYVWASHLSGWKTFAQIPDLAESKPGAGPGGSKPGSAKVGAPPSIGMAKPKGGAGPSAPSRGTMQAANAPPSMGMAGMSLEDDSAAAVRANRPDMLAAPDAQDQWDEQNGLRILDEQGKIRAVIAADGEVKDGVGNTLAFIEANGDCGSADMDYLGTAKNEQVLDRDDQPAGMYDQGKGLVQNAGGTCVLEINKEGVVVGNAQQTAGRVEGWDFHHMQMIAAYIILVDPAYTQGY
tara:strand:+ start:268 stop:1119 length:852 start_codon:yes stop_codon:yes gene_type:complete